MTLLLVWAALVQAPRLSSSGELAALFAQRDSDVTVIDVRDDYTRYLESHIPRAVYLHVEELRAADRGVPNKLLGLVSYTALFSRLGLRPDRPVVIYSAGETRDIDATYLAWILEGLGHPSVYVLDGGFRRVLFRSDRKSTRLNSSHGYISYAVFCLKKKKLRGNMYKG